MVEQLTLNQLVLGSSPSRGTSLFLHTFPNLLSKLVSQPDAVERYSLDGVVSIDDTIFF